jgi:hypothetical protein
MVDREVGQWVVPNPRIPRSFGWLNIIFGSLMLLIGVGHAVMYAVSPIITTRVQTELRKEQDDSKAKQEAKLAALKHKEDAAETEADKQAIRDERAIVEKQVEPDLSAFNDMMGWNVWSDNRLAIYHIAEVSAGMLLNLLMIISGAGLVALAEWARRLAIGVAWLKILRWAAMIVVTMGFILPITAERTQKAFTQIATQMKAQSGGKAVVGPIGSVGHYMAIFGAVASVFTAVLASVYPAISIWCLTRPPARAACFKPAKPKEPAGALEQGVDW